MSLESVILESGGLRMGADIEIAEDTTSDNEKYLAVTATSLSVGFGGTETDPIIGLTAESVSMHFFSDGIVTSAKEIVPTLYLSGINLFSPAESDADPTGPAKLDLQINTRTTDYFHEYSRAVGGVAEEVNAEINAKTVKLFNSDLSGGLKLGLEVMGQKIEGDFTFEQVVDPVSC